MLQDKSKKIFSEISDFLTTSEKVIYKTIDIYRSLKFEKIKTGIKEYPQSTYFKTDLLLNLLLMPLFGIKNPQDYMSSWLKRYLEASASTLYRFKNNTYVSWRKICTQITRRLMGEVLKTCTDDTDSPRCLIVDDSDLHKTGKRIEHVGMIWSHVIQRSILGFKGLFLGYWDSKSFYGIDVSLHKEEGKNQKKPYGLPKKDIKKQYRKKRTKESHGSIRETELYVNKIDNAIAMIKRAIKSKLSFEYLLVDSWFMCDKLIKYIVKQDAHILGMCKMGKSKYTFQCNLLTATTILEKLRRSGKVKWYKRLGMYVCQAEVEFKGTPVKLFFCRNTKRGKWHLLLTTNTDLAIQEAYKIYSIRWSIEVFFKESKKHFGLEYCQSRDFDAQIADVSLAMIHYNIFSALKRITEYETLGGLFAEIKNQTVEITLCKRIWGFMLELLAIIADIFEIEPETLISQILQDDSKKKNILKIISNNESFAA